MGGTSIPGKAEPGTGRGTDGYIFIDALVTLFIVAAAFAGLLAFESLMLRTVDRQSASLATQIEERNLLHANRFVPSGE